MEIRIVIALFAVFVVLVLLHSRYPDAKVFKSLSWAAGIIAALAGILVFLSPNGLPGTALVADPTPTTAITTPVTVEVPGTTTPPPTETLSPGPIEVTDTPAPPPTETLSPVPVEVTDTAAPPPTEPISPAPVEVANTAAAPAAPTDAPPSLVGPPHDTYRNPITFRWSGSPRLSYEVTLRNVDRGFEHRSGRVTGDTWAFDIPAEEFGNWEWWVTDSSGRASPKGSFVFDPHASPGVACRRADLNSDGKVDDGDLEILRANFNPGVYSPGNPADITGDDGKPDGYVDLDDFGYLQSQNGCTYSLQ